MVPGLNAGFLVPLGSSAVPLEDEIGPVRRLRVFSASLSIPKVIARFFSNYKIAKGPTNFRSPDGLGLVCR